MTSERQLAANRANARLSTGPRSDAGKLRSRRNALRHGLAAETVIDVLEDVEDYLRFEAGLLVEYDPQSTVEHELVVRLASLFWRLRRATMIETGLLQIQTKSWRERRRLCQGKPAGENASAGYFCDAATRVRTTIEGQIPYDRCRVSSKGQGTTTNLNATASLRTIADTRRDIAGAFFRVANLNSDVFERIGHYETVLWRQITKTLLVLEAIRQRPPF